MSVEILLNFKKTVNTENSVIFKTIGNRVFFLKKKKNV